MAECNNTGQIINIEVCTDGPVGGGNSSNMKLGIFDLVFVSSKTFAESGWDGSPVTFNGWADLYPNCTVDSSSITVTVGPGIDQVTVQLSITVNSCSSGSGAYSACGGPGPHTFNGSQVVPINSPGGCAF